MTEIKTAQAWGWLRPNGKLVDAWVETETIGDPQNAPVVIVHGMTEAEVHEASALLEKSREVCEWNPVQIHSALTGQKTACGVITGVRVDPTRPCWCGRKVVVK